MADFMVVVTARPGVDPAIVEEAVDDHLARAAATPPAAEELSGAVSRVLTDYWSGLEQLGNRADLFSQFTTYFDDPGRLAGEAARYQGIAAAELQEFAATYLRREERAVVTVVPRTAAANAAAEPAAAES